VSGLVTRLKRTENPAVRLLSLRTAAAVRYATHGHVVRARRVARYLDATADPKLHVGAGPLRLPGWLNTDLVTGEVQLDLGRRLPLPDSSFAYAFGEHVIEHLAPHTAERVLRELHRVLRPGGVLRLTTPDLRKIIAIYEDRNPVVAQREYGRFLAGLTGRRYERGCQILNDYLRLWGHRYVFDEDDLSARLLEAGFEKVQRREPGESEHEALRGIEGHGGAEWVNRAEAMCLEATRPAGRSDRG
jgi:predicted SAM-dependent methyltransferase